MSYKKSIEKIIRTIKLNNYLFFLRVLKISRNSKNLDGSLEAFAVLYPNFKKQFHVYYARKLKREDRELRDLANKIRGLSAPPVKINFNNQGSITTKGLSYANTGYTKS